MIEVSVGSSPVRADQGLTRLESALVTSLVILVLSVVAVTLLRTYSAPLVAAGQGSAAAEAPVSVSVPAAGTVSDASGASSRESDACPRLRGVQRAGFDCSLSLYVPALDLSAVRLKGRYQCPDPVNYTLVKGQAVQKDKKCVLRTAKAGRP